MSLKKKANTSKMKVDSKKNKALANEFERQPPLVSSHKNPAASEI